MSAPHAAASSKRKHTWFFALQPSAAARESILRCQDELSAHHGLRGSRIKPQNLLLRLHVLGAGEALPDSTLAAACAAPLSVTFRPFEITLDHALSFGPAPNRNPFVLCGGPDVGVLKAFHRALGTALRRSGVAQFVSDK